ncbi:MAG: DNA mismatch repair protein MutS [Planctomycetota bacterium]|nr:DNA mismatch repair protein MutS [Planctomycetota bacterium]
MTPKTAREKKRKKRKDQSNPWSTPAMQQYRTFKDAHPECVLFFRMGDFYEMFDEDARVVSKAIGLTLTQRGNGLDMAGVPHHAAEGYLRRMIDQGFRVAVCEQLEDPAQAKGIVKRGVTRVLTPGTLVDECLLDESQSNLLGAIRCDEGIVAIAIVELSTGLFELHECEISRLDDTLELLGLSEIIICEDDKKIHDQAKRFGIAVTTRPSWMFSIEEGASLLQSQFNVTTVNGFGLDQDSSYVGAAGAMLAYLQQTHDDPKNLEHLRPPTTHQDNSFVTLDATTLRSLEVEQTIRGNCVEGSLLWVMQRCRTAMGKRLLRKWLCTPLSNKNSIEERQSMVSAFIDDVIVFEKTQGCLDRVQDVARIAGRVSMGRVTPRDIVALGHSIAACGDFVELLNSPSMQFLKDSFEAVTPPLTELASVINKQCVDSPPSHMRDGGLFRDGIDSELDEARSLQRDAGLWLSKYQASLMEATGIGSLKVGFNKVFGYYIEVTHAQVNNVPDSFTRKQTLKNAERYITPELKDFENKVLTAESAAINREQVLYTSLCTIVTSHLSSIATYADTVATTDTLASFADTARRFGYIKPTLVDEPIIEITEGRHPVLDRLLQEKFVPNDCMLNNATLALITGPNMAGKSTYIRQTALITLLAHTGSFVPASSATIGMTDQIFTRVGASDELHTGQSTFMVEMVETANILNNATKHSLVILDEIGRGTSTLDGLSLAWAITEKLANCGCRSLFATHYHELTTLADKNIAITNLHVTIREWKDDIVFLYRIADGRTDRSYGIHVAKIAGVPQTVITRAHELLDTLTVHTQQASNECDAGSESPQMSLFTEYLQSPLIDELKTIDLESMSPMEAFDMLRDLSRRASDEADR